MKLIARGIFIWDSTERRTNRYGTFNMVTSNYNQDATAESFLDQEEINKLNGKRVKIKAVVIENRDSGHCGDFFLKVFPSKPEINEEINLGVGEFFIEDNVCGRGARFDS